MKHLIKVTQDHINRGQRKINYACPIALALCETWHTDTVYVNDENISLGGLKCKLSRAVQRFIARFDKNKPVKPFNFQLEVK